MAIRIYRKDDTFCRVRCEGGKIDIYESNMNDLSYYVSLCTHTKYTRSNEVKVTMKYYMIKVILLFVSGDSFFMHSTVSVLRLRLNRTEDHRIGSLTFQSFLRGRRTFYRTLTLRCLNFFFIRFCIVIRRTVKVIDTFQVRLVPSLSACTV